MERGAETTGLEDWVDSNGKETYGGAEIKGTQALIPWITIDVYKMCEWTFQQAPRTEAFEGCKAALGTE